jgi:hypothetical protein
VQNHAPTKKLSVPKEARRLNTTEESTKNHMLHAVPKSQQTHSALAKQSTLSNQGTYQLDIHKFLPLDECVNNTKAQRYGLRGKAERFIQANKNHTRAKNQSHLA